MAFKTTWAHSTGLATATGWAIPNANGPSYCTNDPTPKRCDYIDSRTADFCDEFFANLEKAVEDAHECCAIDQSAPHSGQR
ncbi:MAG: hypothetical protein ACF8R7_03815 [Phycisphaerales bacterium JB039]